MMQKVELIVILIFSRGMNTFLLSPVINTMDQPLSLSLSLSSLPFSTTIHKFMLVTR